MGRSTILCIPHPQPKSGAVLDKDRGEIEFSEEGCKITADRLDRARERYSCFDGKAFQLTEKELTVLRNEQVDIQSTLYGSAAVAKAVRAFKSSLRKDVSEGQIDEDERVINAPQDSDSSICTVKAKLLNAKMRSRVDETDSGVLGVQDVDKRTARNSVMSNKFMMYNITKRDSVKANEMKGINEEEEEEIDLQDISYVRKPNMARIIQEYDAIVNHPKYSLKQVVLSRRFHLYANRFANAQFHKTLYYPSLKQPRELMDPDFCTSCAASEGAVTEKTRTRRGHRFIITADTQFGILMDGFAMAYPNWSQEIEISRKCVQQINNMKGEERPLFVCVCGDLVDTESSFSGAIASWKKVMSGWESKCTFAPLSCGATHL